MSITSFDQLLRASRLASGAIGQDRFLSAQTLKIMPADRDRLVGKVKQGRSRSGGAASAGGKGLSRLLDRRTALEHNHSAKDPAFAPASFDTRQRVVVKLHYFNHAAGGGAGLKAHAVYVARDAATRDDLPGRDAQDRLEPGETKREAALQAEAHTEYLARGKTKGSVFYDSREDGVDGTTRAEAWARSDKRHFRVVLSAEAGEKLNDLPAYTREVMTRAGAVIGTPLQWIAADHHDTDNPHTHIIIRGRRANGQDLVLPKDFVKHGFRGIARDVATEWLGSRSAADERRAFQREIIRHAPTRLDRMIEAQLPENGTIRIAHLAAPNGDPSTTLALKARARELERMSLAQEIKRNVLAFQPDWRDRLKAMELHLDIRKRVVRERAAQKQHEIARTIDRARGLLGR